MKIKRNIFKLANVLALALFLAFALFGVNAYATTFNFDSVDASGGAVDATSYLAGYGITLSNVTSGFTVTIQDDRWTYGGGVVTASSPHNFLLITGSPPSTASFTMNFAVPVNNLSFDRIAVIKSSLYPSWQATAYDAGGNPLTSVGESAWGGTRSAQNFALNVEDIKYVVINSDAYNHAAWNGPLLDNFSYTPVPIPGSLLLLSTGLAGLGALRWRRKRG